MSWKTYELPLAAELGLSVRYHTEPPFGFSIYRSDGSRVYHTRWHESLVAYCNGYRDSAGDAPAKALQWRDALVEIPDDDTDVLAAVDGRVQLGSYYSDEGIWRNWLGIPIAVCHWPHLPEPPE